MVIFLVFIFIFLSRVLFLSISPAFFDSLEYLRLFALPSLGEALKQVHYPIHPLWVMAGWLFNKIPFSTTLYKIEFLNAILGTLSCFFIYKIAREFSDKNRSLLITLICAFTPYFWLSQINVLYEPLLGVFLLGSFYFFLKNRLFPAAVFSAGAFLVSSTALIYLVFFAGWFLKKRDLKGFGVLGGGMLLGVLGYLGILGLRGIPAGEFFLVLAAGNSILGKLKLEGVMFFVRGARNSFLVFFEYLTVPVGIVLICLIKRTKKYFFSWIACFLLLNTIWHAGMFGRTGLFLILAPVFLLVKIKRELILKVILVFLIIFSGFKVLPYHFEKIPFVLEKEYLENNFTKQNPLVVVGAYEEPYFKDSFDLLILNSPKTNLNEIKKKINSSLGEKRMVLMTSQAVSVPYWQYDGMNFHILSKRKKYPTTQGGELIDFFEKEALPWQNNSLKIFILGKKIDR